MDSQRLILFFVFTFSVFMLLDAWQRDQQPPTPPAQTEAATTRQMEQAAEIPQPSEKLAARPAPMPAEAPESQGGLPQSEVVRAETDVLIAEVSLVGGDIRRLEFKNHRDTTNKEKRFVLFQSRTDHTYVAQAGLIGSGLPNHRTRYSSTATEVRLGEGQQSIELRLQAPEAGGVQVTKVLRFTRASYVVDVGFEITNTGPDRVEPFAYFQLVRDGSAPAGDSAMLPTFTGVAVYTDREKFQKVDWGDIDKGKTPYPKNSEDGWISMVQHYFFSAWLPKAGMPREFYTRALEGKLYAAGVIVPARAIESGGRGVVAVPLYAGPQDTERLADLAPGLELVVDYGWLTIIAKPLFWLLALFHDWVGNWGVAIILLTIVIKLIFYPLSEASYRSMAKMRVLAPKMQRLKEQYGNDRQRMQQAMMELYKTEQINPLGGCLPILVQIPVFIALYWVLLASVELRHAPFMLWIDDLASPDPWFVLPVLMGISMIVQTRLNPEPPDPIQAKIMKIMPVAFSIFFFFFPAGLVLYWLVNNILSIAQQWHITRKLEQAAARRRK